jgi:peptidoglycan lytic transglycosylase G
VGAGGEFDVGPSANPSDMTVGRDPGTDERSLDGVPSPDPFSFDDPEAQAREERRLERERHRHEREQRRLGARKPAGDGQPAAEQPAAVRPTRVQRARAGMAAARRRLPSRPPSTAIRRRRIAAVVVLAVAALALWFVLALFQPFGGDGEGKVVVTIPKGATASQVGDILERKGVISDGPPLVSGSTLFRLRLSVSGKSHDIPSGTYTLASGMSYGAAIDELTASPAERGTTVVVPEGYTRDQIAKIASDAGLKGNYKQATVSSKLIDLKRYGAGGAKSLEGFLFPASYELDPRSSVDDLVGQQLKEFKQNFDKVDVKYAESKNLTPYDVLTIASMIDREVQVPSERRLVAEVIYNRLEAGEPLGIDATIRYATGNWRDPLTKSELAIDSPYNSRLVAGLPPTPIGNPGRDSIRAAADPGRGDNRWFVVKPGTCGEHVFSDTEQEFNQAAARYQRALEREGGSPTEC